MKELARNKVKYILYRYKLDSKDLSQNLKLELLKKWINDCVEFEEYEMASALKSKRNDLIRSMRIAKMGDKSLAKKLFIQTKWNLRKIIRKIFQ